MEHEENVPISTTASPSNVEPEELSPAEVEGVNDAPVSPVEQQDGSGDVDEPALESNSPVVEPYVDGEQEVEEVTNISTGVPLDATGEVNPYPDPDPSPAPQTASQRPPRHTGAGQLITSVAATKSRESTRSSPAATGTAPSSQRNSRAGHKSRSGVKTHKNFLSRNGVSANYRGPVFAVEDISVPCAGCGTPVDPVRRMPTVGEKQFYHPECLKCFLCGFASTTGVFFTTPQNVAVCCKCNFKGYSRCVPAELAAYVEDRRLHLAADGSLVGTGAERVQQSLADEIDKDYRKLALLTDAPHSGTSDAAQERRMTGGAYFGIDGSARLLLEQRQEQSSKAVVLHQQKQKRISSVSPHDSSRPTKGNAALLPSVDHRGLSGRRARSAQRPPADVQALPYLSAGAKQDDRTTTRRAMNLILRQQLYTVGDPNVLC